MNCEPMSRALAFISEGICALALPSGPVFAPWRNVSPIGYHSAAAGQLKASYHLAKHEEENQSDKARGQLSFAFDTNTATSKSDPKRS